MGKLAQSMIAGARVLAVKGNFDTALKIVKEITENYNVTLVNSLNPYRIEGQKTASFEVCDVLKNAPDFLFIPVGNAGNITAYWKGFNEYYSSGKITKLPKMMGFQAEGSAPIVNNRIIEDPKTIATAIKIGNPAAWKQAVKARDDSGGIIESVSDEQIAKASLFLAQNEGIFAEPGSASCVAGLFKTIEKGYFRKKNQIIVCVLTGHGLKDPEFAISNSPKVDIIEPDKNLIAKKMDLI
jgi:threonine synthase